MHVLLQTLTIAYLFLQGPKECMVPPAYHCGGSEAERCWQHLEKRVQRLVGHRLGDPSDPASITLPTWRYGQWWVTLRPYLRSRVQSYMLGSFMRIFVGSLGSSGGIVNTLRAGFIFPAGAILHTYLGPTRARSDNYREIICDSDVTELWS